MLHSSKQHAVAAARYVGPPSAVPLYAVPIQQYVTYHISTTEGSQQLFKANPSGVLVAFQCWGHGLSGKVEMYGRYDSPPTLDVWFRKSSPTPNGAAFDISPDEGRPYYILIHGLAPCRIASLQYRDIPT